MKRKCGPLFPTDLVLKIIGYLPFRKAFTCRQLSKFFQKNISLKNSLFLAYLNEARSDEGWMYPLTPIIVTWNLRRQTYDERSWHRAISRDPASSLEVIDANPGFPWCDKEISMRVPWPTIADNLDRTWDWNAVTRNPTVTWEIIMAHLDLPWDWWWLSAKSDIPWDFVMANPDLDWCWENFGRHEPVAWEVYIAHQNKGWNHQWILTHGTFTF